MLYSIDSALFKTYPNYVRGVIVAKRIVNIESPIDEVARMLKSAQQTIRARADLEQVAAQPNITAWREAYRAFGAKPSEYPSSIEAMVKRVRRGDEIPYINTLAAVCNSASLRYLVTIGGHALDDIPQPETGVEALAGSVISTNPAEASSPNPKLKLGFAIGTENFTPFGTTSIEHPNAGEVIYSFGQTVLCRRWTWRQAEFTKLEGKTTYAAINIDGLPPVSRDDVTAIMQDLGNLVSMYCGAAIELKMLSEGNSTIEV
jgi:DNA/RNA-binding domain of Phe-tRNA-synthetase-like protein